MIDWIQTTSYATRRKFWEREVPVRLQSSWMIWGYCFVGLSITFINLLDDWSLLGRSKLNLSDRAALSPTFCRL